MTICVRCLGAALHSVLGKLDILVDMFIIDVFSWGRLFLRSAKAATLTCVVDHFGRAEVYRAACRNVAVRSATHLV
jgi:hypothetical protein